MELEEQFVAWAEQRDDIRAAAVVGSRARTDTPADEWSDLDIVVFAHEPAALLERDDWVRAFGPVRLTFLEPTAVGGERERRALYADGTDVDFAIVPVEGIDDPAVAEVTRRGVRVLIDKDGVLARRLAEAPPWRRPPLPSETELDEVVDDFFYHAIWAARKLRRGELFTAKLCLDSYLKSVLLKMLEWHARTCDPQVDTWHNGRFVERWADSNALDELRLAYAHYDEADVRRALFATMELFRRVARETADRLGLAYPNDADEFSTDLVRKSLD